jgi:hypothetical protein
VAITLDLFRNGAVGFIDWLDRSVCPVSPTRERNEKITHGVGNDTRGQRTGERTPSGDATVHIVLDKHGEQVRRDERDETPSRPDCTNRQWYQAAYDKANDSRRGVRGEERQHDQPPWCDAELKRYESEKLTAECDRRYPRIENASRVRQEERWENYICEQWRHDLTRNR